MYRDFSFFLSPKKDPSLTKFPKELRKNTKRELEQYLNSSKASNTEKDLISQGKNPVFYYDVLIYLKLIYMVSDEVFGEVQHGLLTVQNQQELVDLLYRLNIPLLDTSMRRWGLYHGKKFNLLKTLVSSIPHSTEEKTFLLLADRGSYNIVLDKIGYTHTPRNNMQNRTDIAVEPLMRLGTIYSSPSKAHEIYQQYSKNLTCLKIDGLLKEVEVPQSPDSTFELEKLKTDLRNFHTKNFENFQKNVLQTHPLPRYLLSKFSEWPNKAIEERNTRITNMLNTAAFSWTMNKVKEFVRHLQRLGWGTMAKSTNSGSDGNDIVVNSQNKFFEFVLLPVVKEFSNVFVNNVDHFLFPQTKEEAKELVLEYLHLKLSILLGQKNEITIQCSEILKQMILAFPFHEIQDVLKDFNKLYVGLDSSQDLQKALKIVSQNESSVLKAIYSNWQVLDKQKTLQDQISGFWITLTDLDIENIVTNHLQLKLQQKIDQVFQEWKLKYFIFVQAAVLRYNLIVYAYDQDSALYSKAERFCEKVLYELYTDMISLSYDRWNLLYQQQKPQIQNFWLILDQWKPYLYDHVTDRSELEQIMRYYDYENFLLQQGMAPVFIGLENMRENVTPKILYTTIEDYLFKGLSPCLHPVYNKQQLSQAVASLEHWFSVYTVEGENLINYTIPHNIDTLYQNYTNVKYSELDLGKKSVLVPQNYIINQEDRLAKIQLDVNIRYIPPDTETLQITWYCSPDADLINQTEINRNTKLYLTKTGSEPSSLLLRYPIQPGLYWCAVQSFTKEGTLTAEGKSVIVTVDVQFLCIRCKKRVSCSKKESEKNVQMYMQSREQLEFQDVCQWYINPSSHLQLEKKRRLSNLNYYDINHLVDTFVTYLYSIRSLDEEHLAPILTHIIYVPYELKKSAEGDAYTLSEDIHESNVSGELIAYMSSILKYHSFISTASTFEIKQYYTQQVPYCWLLNNLQRFCVYAGQEKKVQIECLQGQEYFDHFSEVLQNIKKKTEAELADAQSYRLNKLRRTEWNSTENYNYFNDSARIKKYASMSQMNMDLVVDSEGYENANRLLTTLQKEYQSQNLQSFLFFGVHDQYNLLPDSLLVYDMNNNAIFNGLHTQITNQYNPIQTANDTLFVDTILEDDDTLKNEQNRFFLRFGSVRLYKKFQLEQLQKHIKKSLDNLNNILESKANNVIEQNIKPLVNEILLTISEHFFSYNQLLIENFIYQ